MIAIYKFTLKDEKMTLTFDTKAYSNLLSQYIPQVIETEEEYDSVLKIVEKLTFAKNRTLEEKALQLF